MKKKINPAIGIMSLFVAGEVMAFGFICLLQFVNAKTNLVGFILTLIGMHVGIVCFILSRKLFKIGIKTGIHYIIEYIF